MDKDSARFDVAFNILPVELNHAIARYLETDKDIVAFRASCRGAKDAIDADNGSFWREKFRRKFALRRGRTNKELKKAYQRRMRWLHRGTGYDFHWGQKRREKDTVEVLREIIVESFQGYVDMDDWGRPRCQNQEMLFDFVQNSKLLLNNTRRATRSSRNEPSAVHPALAAVKLMCSHFLFEFDNVKHGVLGVEESQRMVYMSTESQPIYSGPTMTVLNMEWILHCMNFFRHHMMSEEVGTLYQVLNELPAYQRPSAWQTPLRSGTAPLCKNWKGTYSFLDLKEVEKLRRLDAEQVGDAFFCDKNVDEGKIQSLELEFVSGAPLQWPGLFEDRLQSLRNARPQVKAQGRTRPSKTADACGSAADAGSIQFSGKGVDLDDDFKAIGWLNPLPDQHGVPGWQRITFMKHFVDDFDQMEQDNLWAYEGVVLPGGRIILGRWWYASDEVDMNQDYNGPFILWAVDVADSEAGTDFEDD
ncbi:hypothetical protein DE146DRAFT_763127 [Phaeosphaeria sp. MPI-PUGE-AT-0046c]|nr:hypothetical protein DE146DRAFT_763127 [Phaeosphaeria sp. MPI-PUGE-AT-0046c]